MANKLKNIFTDKILNYGLKIQFKDKKSYEEFLKAQQVVRDEGKAVRVEGINSFVTAVSDGEMVYPLLETDNPLGCIITPSKEDTPYNVKTEYGEKTVLFERYETNHEIIFETKKNEIIYFKINFIKNTNKVTLTYKMQLNNAKTIKNIADSFNIAIAFFNSFFMVDNSKNSDDVYKSINSVKESFSKSEALFKRLYLIEQEFSISFDPTQISEFDNDRDSINELYFLLIEKKAIRLNAKVGSTGHITGKIESVTEKVEIGAPLELTFQDIIEYTIYDQKISIFTANLISNIIVKEVKEDEDGTIKVLYGDIDSLPMYISYTGYKTYEEAIHEQEIIMDHKKKYEAALTIRDYIINAK
jgi:hypothetical protein